MVSAFLIVNPSSGRHLAGAGGPSSATLLRDHGIAVETAQGSLDRQIRASLKSRADIVVADGGDGTVNAVFTAHASGTRPIGIVPAGTMNLLATDYAIPEDQEAAVACIVAGAARKVDAAALGNQLFLHSAFVGLPARMGIHRERRRGRFAWFQKLALAGHALATMRRDPVLTLTPIKPTQSPVKGNSFAFVVGGINLTLPRPQRVEMSAGIITALAIDAQNASQLAQMVAGALSPFSEVRPSLETTLERGTLDGRRRIAHVMLDGEAAHVRLPSTLEVRKDAFTVLAPDPADAAP